MANPLSKYIAPSIPTTMVTFSLTKLTVSKGYVSHNDLRVKIQHMNLLSKRETDLLIEYADEGEKGYLDF